MSIKIFLPQKVFFTKENCDIYGETKIGNHSCISYYIICVNPLNAEKEPKDEFSKTHLRHLGYIGEATSQRNKDVALAFVYDEETPNIYLNKLSIKPEETGKINVFLYDETRVLKLQDLNESANTTASQKAERLEEMDDPNDSDDDNGDNHDEDDMYLLYKLLHAKENYILKNVDDSSDFFLTDIKHALRQGFDFVFSFMMWILAVFIYQRPFKYIFEHTELFEHYREWMKFKSCRKCRYNIALDTFLGVCVMLILVLYIENPADYLIKASHFIVSRFRILLHSLKGSPIGLKLNMQLNNFLLECFGYHVELWDTFLNVIEPCIRYLFVPITFLGSMGLSYQLALLNDIVSVLGLHAHCFSIYAAVLYKVEIKGLQVLWKMFLGKRKNVLKNRVESHSYMNRQLYLGTVFFACLLFLFPTVLTYYVVFTTLRVCIGFVKYILKTIRRRILEFPMEMLLKWCLGNFYDTDSLQLDYLEHTPSPLLQQNSHKPMDMCVFKLSVHSSCLGRVLSCHSGVLQELVANEENSIKTICQKILAGTF